MKNRIILALAIMIALLMGVVSHATAGAELLSNPSFETGSTNTATGWSAGTWGSLKATYTVPTTGAQSGTRSGYVSVTNYVSGDAKWVSDPIVVTPGAKYSYSNWYKSNVPTELGAEVELTTGGYKYLWLGDVIASSDWKQVTATTTMPTNAKRVRLYHLIDRNGWLQTDSYSFALYGSSPSPTPTATTTTTISPTPTTTTTISPAPSPTTTITPPPSPSPTPAPNGAFSRPLASIEFDDGWTSAYQYGLPLAESFGWRPTQYVITETPGWSAYMTATQIQDWNRRGDIGSHTVSHPSLPSLSNAQITTELSASKLYLDNLLGEPTRLFATPYCESNAMVVSIEKLYYQSGRNCEADVNVKATFNPYALNSFIVLNTTTDAEIRNMIAKAKTSNGWVIFVWHEVAGDNKNAWSVSSTTLKRQMQIIKDSGITVVPTQTALNESLGL